MTSRDLTGIEGFCLSALFGGGLASAWIAAQPNECASALAIGGVACLCLLGYLAAPRIGSRRINRFPA